MSGPIQGPLSPPAVLRGPDTPFPRRGLKSAGEVCPPPKSPLLCGNLYHFIIVCPKKQAKRRPCGPFQPIFPISLLCSRPRGAKIKQKLPLFGSCPKEDHHALRCARRRPCRLGPAGEISGQPQHPPGGPCPLPPPPGGADLLSKYRRRFLHAGGAHLAAHPDLRRHVRGAGRGGVEEVLCPPLRPLRPHPGPGRRGGQSDRPGAPGLCSGHVQRPFYGLRHLQCGRYLRGGGRDRRLRLLCLFL